MNNTFVSDQAEQKNISLKQKKGLHRPQSLRPILQLKGIVKRFPGVTALEHVDFELFGGEVHVLFGENGSGKSTLVNVISGIYDRDGGEFVYQDRKIGRWTPQQAQFAGITEVLQEFSLVPDLTVEENLFLGIEASNAGFLHRREMCRIGQKIIDDLGFDLDLKSRVRNLRRADQQMTEIAKALLRDAKLLILDEPTASITEREVTKLFELIERLKKRGVGIIYVSHRMPEIRQVGDRVTVLRDGKRISTVHTHEVTDTQLIEMMTGRKIGMIYPHIQHKPRATLLETKNLGVEGRLRDISLYLREGEIVGIAGLVGHGKSMIPRAIFGLEKVSEGELLLYGKRIENTKPRMMLKKGVFYVPSDRKEEGLALTRPVLENVSMAALDTPHFSFWNILLHRRRERSRVSEVIERLDVRPPKIEIPIKFFSGGNKQKVMLSRGLTRNIRVFLFDEPTVGIDVGAKKEVYIFLKQLAEDGAAVLFVSSELPELLNLCNRVYVAHRGRLVAEFTGNDITEYNVLHSFFDGAGEDKGSLK